LGGTGGRIERITQVDKSATKLDQFQADYRTRGDLRVSTFSTESGNMVSVSSGVIGRTSIFLKFADLTKLRDLVVAAQKKIDEIRQ
jgi:hypothetical protein